MELITGFNLNTLIADYTEIYGLYMVFVGTFLTGEIAILTSFIMSAQGWFASPYVFICAVLGTLAADFFWFSIGRLFPARIQRLALFKVLSESSIFKLQMRIQNYALILLIMKYLYGLRWITIVYLSALNKVSVREFVVYDLLGTIIFVLSLAALGIPAGNGLYNVIPAYHSAVSIVSAIVFALLISTALRLLAGYVKKVWNLSSSSAQ